MTALKYYRIEQKKQQKDVAEIAGVTLPTFRSWENDSTKLKSIAYEKVELLAKHLGITTDEFFTEK